MHDVGAVVVIPLPVFVRVCLVERDADVGNIILLLTDAVCYSFIVKRIVLVLLNPVLTEESFFAEVEI